jgi:hypothetical protein
MSTKAVLPEALTATERLPELGSSIARSRFREVSPLTVIVVASPVSESIRFSAEVLEEVE